MAMMYRLDEKKARALMVERRWSMSDLARESGLAYTTVRELLTTNKRRIIPRTMYKLADTLHVEIEELEK